MSSMKNYPWRRETHFILDFVWNKELCPGRKGPFLSPLYPSPSSLPGLGHGLGQQIETSMHAQAPLATENSSTGSGCWSRLLWHSWCGRGGAPLLLLGIKKWRGRLKSLCGRLRKEGIEESGERESGTRIPAACITPQRPGGVPRTT